MTAAIRGFIFSAAVLLLSTLPSLAQTSPNWGYGFVPTAAQWNALWASKQDYLGAAPCIVSGCTMGGELNTAASTTFSAGLNVAPGVAPSSPVNGDVWSTASGFFVRVNGITVGPLSGGSSSSFAGTSPIGVTFPAGVVTYAFDFTVANTWLAQQTAQGATTTSPGWYAQITGDSVPRVRIGMNATDLPSIAFGPGNAVRDTFIERIGAGSLRFGGPDVASPVAQTHSVQNVLAGTSNVAGVPFTISASRGTGTGAGGAIIFQVAPAGGSGTSQNALVNALTIFGSGGIATGAVGDTGLGTIDMAGPLYLVGQRSMYMPQVAGDAACFCNNFVGNGGANLSHTLVNTNSPGVSTSPVTVTITIASPGVVTWTASSFAQDTPVAFTTTGTLPTGIVPGTTYYVARSPVPTTNTFSIAATVGGAAINTSGSQSGTQSGSTISLEGRYNTSVAQQNMLAIVNGSYNVSVGFEGMFNVVDGSWSTGIGEANFFSNVHGNRNAGLGWKIYLSNTSSDNDGVGYGCMLNNTTGHDNFCGGSNTMYGAAGSTAFDMVGIGSNIAPVITSAHDGVIIGAFSAPNLTSAAGLTIVGPNTGGGITTESNATIIGGGQTGLAGLVASEIRISDGAGVLGFRRDASFNVYLSDSGTGRKVYNYFAASNNNAGTTADSSGTWSVFTGTSGTVNRISAYATGGVTVGTPTGTDKGNGTLNVQGAVYDNGTLPTGTAGSGYARATNPTFAALVNTGLTDISGAGAGQIKFPATQNASADPNTLDDYKEAAWTPVLSFGGASVGIAGTQTGIYTKAGRIVTAMVIISLTSKGSSTGAMSIAGLPNAAAGGVDAPCAVQVNNFAAATITTIQAQVSSGGSAVTASRYAAGANTGLADTDFTNTSVFKATCTYFSAT